MSPAIEILIIFLLIFVNGIFVMSELAIVSARKVRLQQLANQGDTRASTALELASSPTRFLGTVQVGITLFTIISGEFGVDTIEDRLIPIFRFIPLQAHYQEQLVNVIAVIIVTYLLLVFGELIPKRLALNFSDTIATIVAIPIQLFATITTPIVYVLNLSTETILRLLGITPSSQPQVTQEEIRILIEQGTEEGTFEEAEQDMVERVFRLGDRPVSFFMTPRPDIIWLDLQDSTTENQQKILDNGYSRYPVCQDGLDNILGIIPVTDLLNRSLNGEPLDLTSGLEQPVFVPENTRGLKVLELFKQTVNHMVLIVDEYSVIQGLVTLNDILIEIVGDLPSIEGEENLQYILQEDGSWLMDGMLPIDEFFELLKLDKDFLLAHDGTYQTLGGFVMSQLGRIPNPTDNFEWLKMRFDVVAMDGNRVDKVLVTPIDDPVNSIL